MLIESGVTWLPPCLWRFAKFWRGVRNEVPWIDRSPAEIVRDHVRLTIQPFDAPPDAAHIGRVIDSIGRTTCCCSRPISRTGSSTGDEMLPAGLPAALRRQDPDRQSARHLSATAAGPALGGPHDARAPLAPLETDLTISAGTAREPAGIIDGDVHPSVQGPVTTSSPTCRRAGGEHLEIYGSGAGSASSYDALPQVGAAAAGAMPGRTTAAARAPTSHLIRSQYLDAYGIENGILGPLGSTGQSELNLDFSAALGARRQRLAAATP